MLPTQGRRVAQVHDVLDTKVGAEPDVRVCDARSEGSVDVVDVVLQGETYQI